jgi:hypothetical protein
VNEEKMRYRSELAYVFDRINCGSRIFLWLATRFGLGLDDPFLGCWGNIEEKKRKRRRDIPVAQRVVGGAAIGRVPSWYSDLVFYVCQIR